MTTYSEITEIIRSGKLCPIKIQDYLRYPENYLHSFDRRSAQLMKDSLNNLTVASALYRHLPGATVSISVVQILLYTVKWAVYGQLTLISQTSDFLVSGSMLVNGNVILTKQCSTSPRGSIRVYSNVRIWHIER